MKRTLYRIIYLYIPVLLFIIIQQAGIPAAAKEKPPENETYLQAFYWEMNRGEYAEKYPGEANLWQLITQRSHELAELGITGVWLPPANKAEDPFDEGYAAYDLWDLGEFNQKGSIRTKYGTWAELEQLIEELHNQGIKVFYDAVLNHRMGGDEKEEVILASGKKMELLSRFELKGREQYYSKADEWQWDWQAFDGIDLKEPELFAGKRWDNSADQDYLMGLDIDYQNQLVIDELKEWGLWIINEVGFDGFRLDALKHIDTEFISEWINYIQDNSGKEVIFIGEAWYENNLGLILFLKKINNEHIRLFDFSLRRQFSLLRDGSMNMKALDRAGLVNDPAYGERMITFVDNHDTGRDHVEYTSPIFRRKCQAYTYIMCREQGIPMLYWKDFYASGIRDELEKILIARRDYAYGPSYEVENNDAEVYSYVRAGLEERPGSGLVMMIAGGDNGELITREINSRQSEQLFYDLTGNVGGIVKTDENGTGHFSVINSGEKGWSIWVPLPLKE
ncbi:MAG: DUF1939 domain-containing protein [Halanaerobiaceae bacterium]|nr:DUF1939 domain-containing protein [Halanaerobiaceae bacterium]